MYGMGDKTKWIVSVRREDTRRAREYTVWSKTEQAAREIAVDKACIKEGCSQNFLEVASIREAAK